MMRKKKGSLLMGYAKDEHSGVDIGKTTEKLKIITEWLQKHKLKLAPHKTEVILLVTRKYRHKI